MNSPTTSKRPAWVALVAPYQKADVRLAVGQILNTFLPFLIAWYLAYRALTVSYWLTLGFAALAALLVVRIFIIQHDCGHGSFLPSKKANDWVGRVASVLTMTPYHAWRRDHAVHHATAGNLDDRGTGDIRTLTVREYAGLKPLARLVYRLYRHPLVLFGIGPLVHFVLFQRLTVKLPKTAKRERVSVHVTNLAIVALWGALIWLIGWRAFLLVELPVIAIAASAGVFLFYVQHQFDEAYWVRSPDWDYESVALQGSSYYKLPRVLQWFTGNIGFHHVHHLSPRIPNYFLQKCHDENEYFQQALEMTLWPSLKTIPLTLWDEERQRLISFRQLQRQTRPDFEQAA